MNYDHYCYWYSSRLVGTGTAATAIFWRFRQTE